MSLKMAMENDQKICKPRKNRRCSTSSHRGVWTWRNVDHPGGRKTWDVVGSTCFWNKQETGMLLACSTAYTLHFPPDWTLTLSVAQHGTIQQLVFESALCLVCKIDEVHSPVCSSRWASLWPLRELFGALLLAVCCTNEMDCHQIQQERLFPNWCLCACNSFHLVSEVRLKILGSEG